MFMNIINLILELVIFLLKKIYEIKILIIIFTDTSM